MKITAKYDSNKNFIKPPIGIMPGYIWRDCLEVPSNPSKVENSNRIKELKKAIKRFNNSVYEPLPEWFIEIELLSQ